MLRAMQISGYLAKTGSGRSWLVTDLGIKNSRSKLRVITRNLHVIHA